MRKEMLAQRLARRVAKGTDINTTTGAGHTEWVELETFPGNIAPFVGDKDDGALEVKKQTDRVDKICFRADGLRLNFESTGASVVWCDLDLKTQKTYLSTNQEVFNAELYRIQEALEIPLKNRRA